MSLSFHHLRKSPARAGFTLVEMLTVMAIVAIMTGLGVAAFRGGSNGNGTSGAASVASSVFGQARAEAIMRRATAAVLVDADVSSSHRFRRLIVVYLNTTTNKWVVVSPWVTLPGNNYFDPGYSNPFGSLTSDTTTLVLPGDSGFHIYAYYAFDATGQANLINLGFFGPGTPNTTATSAAGQFVVSPGTMAADGTFTERNSNLPGLRYGFYLFPLGRIAFFQDVANDLSSPPDNAWPQ